MIWVAVIDVTTQSTPSITTEIEVVEKLMPLIVTDVPPVLGPNLGEILRITEVKVST